MAEESLPPEAEVAEGEGSDDSEDDGLTLEQALEDDSASSEESTVSFGEQFKAEFGVSVDEAKQIVLELQQQALARSIHSQKLQLASSWQVDVDVVEERLAEVATVWSRLSAAEKQLYDNIEGVRKIWDGLTLKRGSTHRRKQATAATNKAPKLTREYIRSLSDDEFESRRDEILNFLANNR